MCLLMFLQTEKFSTSMGKFPRRRKLHTTALFVAEFLPWDLVWKKQPLHHTNRAAKNLAIAKSLASEGPVLNKG